MEGGGEMLARDLLGEGRELQEATEVEGCICIEDEFVWWATASGE